MPHGSNRPISTRKHERMKAMEQDLALVMQDIEKLTAAFKSLNKSFLVTTLRIKALENILKERGLTDDDHFKQTVEKEFDRLKQESDPDPKKQSADDVTSGDSNSKLPKTESSGGSSQPSS